MSKQTSLWRESSIALFLVLLIGITLLLLLNSQAASAIDYEVTAKVPAGMSSQPAVITMPVNGTVVSNSSQQIGGTCPVLSPALIVLLWRDSSFLGSSACGIDGTFSIGVTLTEGVNYITPKITNITNDPGVDGVPVSVTLQTIIPTQPAPDNSRDTNFENTAQDPTSNGSSGPNTLSPDIEIVSDSEFLVVNSNGEVSLSFVIKNGDAPYILNVDWGDGSSNTYRYTSGGRKTIKHTYSVAHGNSIKLRITDKNGKQFLLVLGAVDSTPLSYDQTKSDLTKSNMTKVYAVGGTVLALILIKPIFIQIHNFVHKSTISNNSKTRKSHDKK